VKESKRSEASTASPVNRPKCVATAAGWTVGALRLPVYDPLSPRVTVNKPAPAAAACSIRAELLGPRLAEETSAAALAVAVGVASCIRDRLSRSSSRGCTVQLVARTHRFACKAAAICCDVVMGGELETAT